MNNNDSSGSKSIKNISSHKERKYDTIPFRLDFIKELLKDKELEPIIDSTSVSTESYIPPNGYKYYIEESTGKSLGSNDDTTSHDIRLILNKKKHDFYKVINDIGGKLLYIKSGTTGHTFKGIVKTGDDVTINYAVKVVAYPKREKYGDLNDIRRPENAELMMIRLLSYFVVKKQTPHIVLPIGTFYTNIKPFINLIDDKILDKDNKKYNEFVDRHKKGEYYENVSILISEWANRGDLLEFMRNHYKEFTLLHWKVFFFQIISVLAVIQSKFPSFRHNDLKANNILVHKVSQRGTLFKYIVCKRNYIVPNIGYQIKLWDFDFACIPGIVDNAKVDAEWTDEINVKPVQNRYYDMHYFFNTLIKKGFFPEFIEDPIVPQEAKDFVNRIIPQKYQYGEFVTKRGRILINHEHLIPEEILKTDKFFEEFRNYQSKNKQDINKNIESMLSNSSNHKEKKDKKHKKYILSDNLN
jgi:Protein tyrosine and serine/threonine kinase